MMTSTAIRKRGHELADEICKAADRMLPALKILANDRAMDPVRKSDVVDALFDDLTETIGPAVAKSLRPIEAVPVDKTEPRGQLIPFTKSAPALSIVEIAKAMVEDGTGSTLGKMDFWHAIQKGAAELPLLKAGAGRARDETVEQRVARFIEKTDVGRLLHEAYKLAPGAGYQARKAAPADVHISKHYRGLEALAERIRAENPGLTSAQAFAKALTTAEGRELYQRDRDERLGRIHKATTGMTPSWPDAEDHEPEVERVDSPTRRARELHPGRQAEPAPPRHAAQPPKSPSMIALQALAEEYRAADPTLSEAQAFSRAMHSKPGTRLYRAWKAEVAQGHRG